MPLVVSDASPLIFLAAAGRFDLLRHLYGSIVVPTRVFQEVTQAQPSLLGAAEAGQAVADGWTQVKTPAATPLDGWLRSLLDEGESQAIVLALEIGAAGLLMDESDGREIAGHLGLKPIGTLGVLLRAKGAGLVPAVKPILTELRQRHSFRISDELLARALAAAGEVP
jgi:predicted nucleic acid-binding protein